MAGTMCRIRSRRAIRGDGSNIRYMYICTVVGRRMSKGRLILDLKRGHQQCDI